MGTLLTKEESESNNEKVKKIIFLAVNPQLFKSGGEARISEFV